MMLESTDFNSDYWSRFTEDEFVELNMKSVVYREYANREELFREAYKLIQLDIARTTETDKSF